MCCFTEEVEVVADTNIYAFARGPRQHLVYSMAYGAKSELAMVLPLPVPPGSPEDALRFVNLEECPDFFDHLRAGFPAPRHDTGDMLMLGGVDVEERTLEVHQVGSFEASFVPRPEDFGRLDERFRLPAEIWLELNHYRDWGFAVFKLKSTRRANVHPMAFDFPRRDRARLFFPTLHVHHRRFDRAALFDHMLYCQPEPAMNWHLQGWEESAYSAGDFIKCKEAAPLFDLDYPCWRLPLEHVRENKDTWLGKGGSIPQRCSYPDLEAG